MKSRFVYELVQTEYFVNDLKSKYSLPSTTAYEKFLNNMIVKRQSIDPNFFETPAMCKLDWTNTNCKDRAMFTRYSFHGYHFLVCSNKCFHLDVTVNCKCIYCDSLLTSMYHLLECVKKPLTLSQAFCYNI